MKNDLDELSILIQGLSYAKFDQNTKREVQEMISELKKVYDNIIKVLSPFYDILDVDPTTFQTRFNNAFEVYKKADLKHSNKFDYHCKNVTDKLRSIARKKNRFFMLRSTRAMLKRMNDNLDLWFMRDDVVRKRIEELDDNLSRGLAPIRSTFKGRSKKDAQNKLREFLLESKPSFEQIQRQQQNIVRIGHAYKENT